MHVSSEYELKKNLPHNFELFHLWSPKLAILNCVHASFQSEDKLRKILSSGHKYVRIG